MKKCEYCGKEHDGSYGSGRFCSSKCARKYSNSKMTDESRKRRDAGLRKGGVIAAERKKKKGKKKRKNNIKSVDNKALHTLSKGKIGELLVAAKFIDHGYDVFIPLVDKSGIDLIVKKDDNIKKIQVKTSATTDEEKSVSCFSLTKHNRHISHGTYTQHKKRYSTNDIDMFALYSTVFDDVYLVENSSNTPMSFRIRNRYSSPKGTQPSVVHLASDYQIDKVLDEIDMGCNQSDIIDGEFIEFDDENNEDD